MTTGTFTLAERLGVQLQRCSVPGCTRTWVSLPGEGLGISSDDHASDLDAICPECREKLKSLRDVARQCARPGCSGTWTWTAREQLESSVLGGPPPERLCQACHFELERMHDREVPCSVSGCKGTVLVSRMQQMVGGETSSLGGQEPRAGGVRMGGPMCDSCRRMARRLKDREVLCGIHGCTKKWIWTADEQLIAFASGRSNRPPRRMCESCREAFGGLRDREIRCRTPGCKNTWTWTRSDQLDACVAGQGPPKAPAHMCERCLGIWKNLKDVERPCRRPGCDGTWIDKRGAQLARAVRGKSAVPHHRLCERCEKELSGLADRQIPCRTEGCSGTWTWTREQQMAAGVHPVKEGVGAAPEHGQDKIQPPRRLCGDCIAFLKNRKTLEIACSQCGTPIFWPPESQLQTHLGNWAQPTLCGACKLSQVQADREAARERIRRELAQPQGTMPTSLVVTAQHGE
jgi:hypothetical protein